MSGANPSEAQILGNVFRGRRFGDGCGVGCKTASSREVRLEEVLAVMGARREASALCWPSTATSYADALSRRAH
jgi:hypothetical protein